MYTIAVAGKGGSGKTTLSALIIKWLIKNNKTPVLAVDADPNENLDIVLGMKIDNTIADLREEVLERKVPNGMSKTDFVSMRLEESISEGEGVDLISMGRPESSGCYCAVNNLLRDYLGKVSKNYKYVVVDNEAGMEHLSRRTTNDVDLLIFVSNPTVVGLKAVMRANDISDKIKLNIKKKVLILTQVKEKISEHLQQKIDETGLELIGNIGYDEVIEDISQYGKPLLDLNEGSQVVKDIDKILKENIV